MTLRVGYLLHRFPMATDTFIRREITWLKAAGLDLGVISVWTPQDRETTPAVREEWRMTTNYLLPAAPAKIIASIFSALSSSPGNFLAATRLAWATARPGLRGLATQLAYFLEAILAAKVVREQHYSHLHNHIGDQSATVAMLAARLTGIGYSMTIHGWPVFFNVEKHRMAEKISSAGFTRSISHFCRSQLMLIANATDPERFKIVHCGIEIDRYHQRPASPGVRRLLCVARMSAEKGLTFLLEGTKLLRDRGQDVELVIAGDGPIRTELERLAATLGVAAHVRFLGFISEAEVAQELSRADVFILTSYVEGVPVSAMEAMASGVPVVATNVGGTSELIADQNTGLLIAPSDPEAVCDAVSRLADDDDLRRRVIANGRRKVEREFDGNREFPKLLEHFKTYGLRPYGE